MLKRLERAGDFGAETSIEPMFIGGSGELLNC